MELAAFEAGGVELKHQAPFGVAGVEAEEIAAVPAGGDDGSDEARRDRHRLVGRASERLVVGERPVVEHPRRLLEHSADRQQAGLLGHIGLPILGHVSSMPHMAEFTG